MIKSKRSALFLFLALLVISFFITLISSTSMAAHQICGNRESLLKQLEGGYKESPISMGLASNGSVIELTKSDEGTWTILLTTPKGITCLIAAGGNWENIEPKSIEQKS